MRKNILAAFFILMAILGYAWWQQARQPDSPRTTSNETTAVVLGRIGEGYFNFEVADSMSKRSQGLSGREQLAPTDAMLFVFESEAKHCFWMNDMKFSIDILWFSADKKLVYEQRNVSPDTYPKSFCPDAPAQYVVEMTAGTAERNQVVIGQTLDVEL